MICLTIAHFFIILKTIEAVELIILRNISYINLTFENILILRIKCNLEPLLNYPILNRDKKNIRLKTKKVLSLSNYSNFCRTIFKTPIFKQRNNHLMKKGIILE